MSVWFVLKEKKNLQALLLYLTIFVGKVVIFIEMAIKRMKMLQIIN